MKFLCWQKSIHGS
uniref:Early nodulin-40 n=1 Tax=Pisum sativum TaxID=3888 RepID=NO40_PEA|nr:RecName: Full=Early nodulin-40 [Pisum sativum]